MFIFIFIFFIYIMINKMMLNIHRFSM